MKEPRFSPLFISFSGIDGAGKSTQIESLCARIRNAGLTVRVITFWDEVATFRHIREATGHTLFKGEKGVGSPDRPVNRRDKNVQSVPMTLIRYFLYFSDAISLWRIARKASRDETDLIIFDRYAYDELANLRLENRISRGYTRFILKLVPKPDISYLLDADPARARARKPEYPLDFLFICRERYLKLSVLAKGITVIPSSSVSEVERQISDHLMSKVALSFLE